jgi:hypothetical protein
MWVMGLVTVLLALMVPATAQAAETGSVTFAPASDGDVSATYTANSEGCTEYDFCGWYPYAVQNRAEQACHDYVRGDGRLTWICDLFDDPGSTTGTEVFTPVADPVRVCVYVSGPNDPSGRGHLVGEGAYSATGAPIPDPQPYERPRLSVAAAKRAARSQLRVEFGKRWVHGHARRLGRCDRLSVARVRCIASWSTGDHAYRGPATVLAVDEGDRVRPHVDLRVRRVS